MKTIAYSILMCIASLLPALLTCTDAPTAGNGTQTGNPVLTGILYNPDGSRAVNAKVIAIPADHNPISEFTNRITAIDSTITNDTGGYSFDSLPDGYYNIFGKGDQGLSYNDSILIIEDTANAIPPDTLKSAGNLHGVVRLQPGDDSRTVVILVFGTFTWAAPTDFTGNFTLANMAEGTYHVRFLTTLDDYDPLDTNLTILSGVDDTLTDTIFLPFTGIPIPTGLTLTYDTLKQIVILMWDKADTTLVKGYNVYRKHSDSDFVKINPALITETTYSDSSVIQDESYEYKIKAVNKRDEEGEFSLGITVFISSAFEFINSFIIGTVEPFRFALGQDTSIYVAYRSEPFVNIYNKSGDSTNSLGSGRFSQVYGIALDSKENIYVVDPDRDKLMKFNKNGDSLAQWTIDNPRDIVIDSQDNIYINFSFNLAIAKFDTNGIIVDSIRLSEEIGKLIIGINGNIFFPDNSGKINEYNSNLSFINSSEIIFKGNKMTSIIGIDNVGNLYFKRNVMIGQSSYNRIYIFNSGGQFLAKFGFFYYLNDIEFLNSTVYIVDFNSDPWLPQIQIYSIPF